MGPVIMFKIDEILLNSQIKNNMCEENEALK